MLIFNIPNAKEAGAQLCSLTLVFEKEELSSAP
jgi:hypothetical protein